MYEVKKDSASVQSFLHTLVQMKYVLFVLNSVFKVTPNTEAAGPRALAQLQRNGAAGPGLSITVVFGREVTQARCLDRALAISICPNIQRTGKCIRRIALSRDLLPIREERLWGCATHQP